MSHQPSTIILTQKTQKTQKTLVALAVTSGVINLPTTDDTDYTDCRKSRCSCWRQSRMLLSTISHRPSTIIRTQISQIPRRMHCCAHRPPGWLLFQPQMTRITQIIANRDALARRKSRMLLSTINHQPSSIIKSVLDKRIPGIVLGKTVAVGGCTHELDNGGMYGRVGSGRVVR